MKPEIRHSIDMRGAGDQIKKSVMAWAGVEALPHRFGGTEYRYGRKRWATSTTTGWPTCPYLGSFTMR
jgi:hypothetical protein